MTMSFISVLPPRLPLPQNDLAGMLASWMDSSHLLDLSSKSCREDLETIGALRRDIARTLGELTQSHDEDSLKERYDNTIYMLHKYYHYLSECEEHGMVQQAHQGHQGGEPSFKIVALEWESSVITVSPCKIQTFHTLESERANVIWNLATFEASKASKQDLETKRGWNKASKCLQNAASWLRHLLTLLQEQEKSQQDSQHPRYLDMSPTFIRFWQALLLAQAQHCVYESLAREKRSMHLLAAKLAAATVPLYDEVESIFQLDKNSADPLLPQCSDLVQTWANFAQAWGVYLACQTHYHQSQIDREKKLWGQEIARLGLANEHATHCKNICNVFISAPSVLDELRLVLENTLKVISDRLVTAKRENNEKHNQKIPGEQELAEIRGQEIASCGEPLSKLLPKKETCPIFCKKTSYLSHGGDESIVNNCDMVNKSMTEGTNQLPTSSSSSSSPLLVQKEKAVPNGIINVQNYVEVFKLEMNEIVSYICDEAEEQTELARLELNKVNLPHSIIAYQQQQAGGGLPDDLWQRVHKIQMEHQVAQLQQDLWVLKDAADSARKTYHTIKELLDFDIENDEQFRTDHPDFEGYDPREVQKGFRQRLKTFDTLLSTAQEGDSKLFPRLEQLNVEPKYNLLQFSKSQLDRLLPAAREHSDSSMIFDTHLLSNLWAELLDLFQERDSLLNMIRDQSTNYDILGELQSDLDPTTATVTKHVQQAFDGMRSQIEDNMIRQDELMNSILTENEAFIDARTRTANSQSADSCIVMIEDAIEEINQLSDHLKEGKRFYSVVNPKMDALNRQVEDISAQLTADRLEYEDEAKRTSQELKDELMAKTLFSNEEPSSPAATDPSPPADSSPPPASAGAGRWSSSRDASANEEQQPNRHSPVASTSRASTMTKVDDGQVARLISMGFNPDDAVAALEKHDNNFDNALHELLQ
eukprot:jgi/Psemu1/325389/estExt_fgenesh1_pg.C_2340013